MPYYPDLRIIKSETQRVKIIDNILALKNELIAQVPRKTLDSNLLIATWNIRELGKNSKATRLPETFYYMAEVISAFDLVAVQEVGEQLDDLQKLMKILGREWDYIITDITEGASGNKERLAFVYDTRKVLFRKMAGEIVLPSGKKGEPKQIARTPFIVAFQSGWFRFYITTVHIYYGKESKNSAEYKRRVKEIEDLSLFLANRVKREKSNHLILGDFNITGTAATDPTMNALQKGGFKIPDVIKKLPDTTTNANKRDMPYDQIAFIEQPGFMHFADNANSAGIFQFFNHVFTDADAPFYEPERAKTNIKKYNEWRTYQMSDHLPLWLEFKVDFSHNYLNKLKTKEY